MSYCVNCGVELDHSAKKCPLCSTIVINPNDLQKMMQQQQPFPGERGEVETVKRKDFGLLISVVCLATAVTCGVLNALVFNRNRWSLAVIGVCAILWVLLIPVFINKKQSVYLTVFFDGGIVGLYLYLLTYMTASDEWFRMLGLPIVALIILIVTMFVFCIRNFSKSILPIGLYLFTGIGLLCLGLEILIDYYVSQSVHLAWSAVVLTVCAIIDITFITMLSHRRLRNAVRRRLHF